MKSITRLMPAFKQYEMIAMVEVELTYLAAAAFAASLKSIGWFGKSSARIISLSVYQPFC